jgi:hypothetical protein
MTQLPHAGGKTDAAILRVGHWFFYAAGTLVVLALVHQLLRPWYMNWGATDEELHRTLPGDELAPDSPNIATHAITIQAPPEKVWPWIAQIGRDRAGWYSYTWLENLCLSDSTDSYEVHPEWQSRRPGENIWLTPPYRYHGNMRFVVYSFQPEHSMVLLYPGEREQLGQHGPPVDNTWVVNLFPQGAHASRLVMRARNRSTSLPVQIFLYFIFEPVHFFMERKMLLTLKELVEKSSSHP